MLLILLAACCMGCATATDTDTSYRLYLVRHAEKQPDGSRDPVLTEAGKHRSKQLANWLRDKGIEDIWSSDYKRSRDTAKPLISRLGLELSIYDPRDLAALAAKLLEKNGFSQDGDGKWLLPDGTPWKFTVHTDGTPGRWAYQNAQAAFVEWTRFGLDASFEVSQPGQLRIAYGDFDVSGTQTHGSNYLENPDLFRTFTAYHSDYLEPVLGERHFGQSSRWTNPRVDEILDQIQVSDPTDADLLEPLGLELLQIFIEELPGISYTTSLDPYAVSDYYWTGWPSGEDPFVVPYHHYPNFKYLLTFLEPTGR